MRRLTWCLFGLLLPACGSGSSASSDLVVDTLAGGVVRVRHTVELDRLGRVLEATEVLRLGAVEAESPHSFGQIGGLAIDADGHVYVFDRQGAELRAFGEDGAHRFSFGRSGAGPGEFRDVRGMTWSPNGTLWIADFGNQRYTEVTREGELVAMHRARLVAWPTDWRGRFDHEGRLYEVAAPAADPGQRVYVRHGRQGSELIPTDTFPLPDIQEPALFLRMAAGMVRVPVPFAPSPSWAFDGEAGVWSAGADRYRIAKRTLAGDTVLLLEVAHSPLPVAAEDRAAAHAELQALSERLGASAGDIDLSGIPATKPAHGRIRVDDRGRLWVPRTPEQQAGAGDGVEPTRFDVFDGDGRYLGQVTLDVRPDLRLAFAGDRVAGVLRDALDVEYVVVYRIGSEGTLVPRRAPRGSNALR